MHTLPSNSSKTLEGAFLAFEFKTSVGLSVCRPFCMPSLFFLSFASRPFFVCLLFSFFKSFAPCLFLCLLFIFLPSFLFFKSKTFIKKKASFAFYFVKAKLPCRPLGRAGIKKRHSKGLLKKKGSSFALSRKKKTGECFAFFFLKVLLLKNKKDTRKA
jgi:hypothetical protein